MRPFFLLAMGELGFSKSSVSPLPFSLWPSLEYSKWQTSMLRLNGCSPSVPTVLPKPLAPVMNIMTSWLPVNLATSTEVGFVKGSIGWKPISLKQVCFRAKLSGMQKHEDSNRPLCRSVRQYHDVKLFGLFWEGTTQLPNEITNRVLVLVINVQPYLGLFLAHFS